VELRGRRREGRICRRHISRGRGNILLVRQEGLATRAGGNGPSRCAEGTNANGDLRAWPRAPGIGARGNFLVHSNLGALAGALLEHLAIGLR
jgi:hypothetical protein